MLNQRSTEKELIDLGPDFYSPEEYAQCLKMLFQINRLLGFFRHTINTLKRFPNNSSVVDVGCGGGLLLLNLGKHYPKMHLLGLDTSEQAIRLAQKELDAQQQPQPNIKFQLQHQPELTLAPNSVDVILATLVCHHLNDEALPVFLAKATEAARMAVLINDLHRNIIAYWLYKILSPLLFHNRLITHDGLLSIKKSFTKKELQLLLKRAQIDNYQIKWHFPFRWSILILKQKG
ncbi:MAG: methyltransferase domain-containing protein [Legionellales bacterium]